jgi:hypothetical protein
MAGYWMGRLALEFMNFCCLELIYAIHPISLLRLLHCFEALAVEISLCIGIQAGSGTNAVWIHKSNAYSNSSIASEPGNSS